jgi:hypothetical protein
VPVTSTVKSLGAITDSTLSFNEHVNSMSQSSHSHQRALRHIRKLVSKETAITVASAMVLGRLDYCNSVLHVTSAANIRKLQRFQNSLAHLVTGTRRSDHIMPVLARLHWRSTGLAHTWSAGRSQFVLVRKPYSV